MFLKICLTVLSQYRSVADRRTDGIATPILQLRSFACERAIIS